MSSSNYINPAPSKAVYGQTRLVFLRLITCVCSGVICLSALGLSVRADVREIRILDGSGLFRAQGVIVEPVADVSATPVQSSDTRSIEPEALAGGATVEVLLERMPVDGLQLSPLDSIGEPLTAQMVGERDGKLMFHFSGVRNGSWELNAPSEELLEVRVVNNPG